MARLGTAPRIIFLALLLGAVVGLQFSYDLAKPAAGASLSGAVPPSMLRMVDMGFHPAVASFLWAATMPEILDLFRGRQGYIADLAFLNAVDPKMSYPYAFSVLALPIVPKAVFPDAVNASFAIGRDGLANADADWRIPYYMAINYYLELKDKKDAQWYFDIAARTPGVPSFAARFALNFGIGSNERQKTEQLWETIRDSTNDEFTKARAQAYIDRLTMFDYLEAAVKVYRQKYGAYPATPDDMVTKGIIPSVPQDPFGFTFVINKDGTAGIDLTKLPAYISAGATQ
jgi:hypothetical protein